MYSQFKKLTNQKDRTEFKKFVENADIEELCNMMTTKICNPDAPKILDDLLQAFSDTPSSQTKKWKLVESVIKSLRKVVVTSAHVDVIISRIVIDFPRYSKLQLMKLVEYCHASIQNNNDDFTSWKDILPLLLEILGEEKYINYNGSEVSGPEYKSLIVKSICNSHWDLEILTSLAKMFGEMSLEKDDHDIVIRVLCDKLSIMEPNEIPPLVHQLLRLCRYQDSRLLLGTLRKYFAKHYSEAIGTDSQEQLENIGKISLREIQGIESTVLYHIYQAGMLSHKSLNNFIRSLRNVINSPEFILDPFIMAILLLVSNIYEDQVFEILKMAINRTIQDDEKRKNSAWLRTLLPDSWNIMEVIGQVIDNSNKDRQLVLKGLVDLAFVLMNVERKIKDEPPTLSLKKIGVKILQKLVKKRHDIGATVLQILTDKIVAGGCSVAQYTDCLEYMCRKLTVVTLDYQIWVINLIEQLLAIPGTAAIQVLYAILPLVRVSPTVRNVLVLVLRKGLYRKGTYTRQMAVIGFLQLLKNLKMNALTALSQSGNCSTSTSSSASATSILTQVTLEKYARQAKSNPRHDAALCHEVLCILKRCFTHEVEVRLHLYEGLYDVILMNPELSEHVIQMLLTHFNQYYETDENILPPLKFHLCSDIHGAEAVLQEPIGELIFAMQKIYVKTASRTSTELDKLETILKSLCKRMLKTELEHLNLDDRTDLLNNVPKSQQKLYNLKLMITVYEALIAFKIGAWSTESTHTAQNIYSLFEGYNRLVEFTKRVNKPKKGDAKNKKDADATADTTNKKHSRLTAIKLPKTLIDLNTIYKILSLLYLDSVPWTNKEQSIALRGRKLFHHYTFQTCIQILQNTKLLKDTDLQQHKNRNMNYYLKIGELLYKQVVSNLDDIRGFDQQTAVLGLECFKELCDLMCTSFPSELPKFLNSTGGIETAAGLDLQLQGLISPLRIIMTMTLKEDEDEEAVSKKISSLLMETISHLIYKIPFNQTTAENGFNWLNELTQIEDIEQSVALTTLQLMLFIEERNDEYGDIFEEICVRLCEILGTVDQSEVSMRETFKIINDNTVLQAHNALSTSLKHKLNNASWLLGRLKAEQVLVTTPGMDEESYRENLREKERSLCRQLAYIIQIQQTLANTSIDPGPNTDGIFRNVQQLYNVLSNLTKYFHSKSTAQNPAFQAVRFIQVVQLAGKPLKTSVYNLITHIEEKQNKKKSKSTDTFAQRNKVLKETKLIPKVIYEIEQFNKDILLLGKKTGIPLENYNKHSITRDFRIKNPQLMEGLEKLDVSLLISQASAHNTSHIEESGKHASDTVNSDTSDSPSPTKIAKLKKTSQ